MQGWAVAGLGRQAGWDGAFSGGGFGRVRLCVSERGRGGSHPGAAGGGGWKSKAGTPQVDLKALKVVRVHSAWLARMSGSALAAPL